MNATLIAATFDLARSLFSAAIVTAKIGETAGIQGLMDVTATDQEAAQFGMGSGYSGTLYIKKSDLNGVTCEAGNPKRITLTIGDKNIDKRVLNVREIGGTVLALQLGDQYA